MFTIVKQIVETLAFVVKALVWAASLVLFFVFVLMMQGIFLEPTEWSETVLRFVHRLCVTCFTLLGLGPLCAPACPGHVVEQLRPHVRGFEGFVADYWLFGAVSLALGAVLAVAVPRVIRTLRGLSRMTMPTDSFTPETVVEGSDFYPASQIPACQAVLETRFGDIVGYCVRIGSVLFFPKHIAEAHGDTLYILHKDGKRRTRIDASQATLLVTDLLAIQMPEDVFSRIGLVKPKVTVPQDQLASIAACGMSTMGNVGPAPSPYMFAYQGSTTGGFSGAAYMFGPQLLGIHIGNGGPKYENVGIGAQFLQALTEIQGETATTYGDQESMEYDTQFEAAGRQMARDRKTGKWSRVAELTDDQRERLRGRYRDTTLESKSMAAREDFENRYATAERTLRDCGMWDEETARKSRKRLTEAVQDKWGVSLFEGEAGPVTQGMIKQILREMLQERMERNLQHVFNPAPEPHVTFHPQNPFVYETAPVQSSFEDTGPSDFTAAFQGQGARLGHPPNPPLVMAPPQVRPQPAPVQVRGPPPPPRGQVQGAYAVLPPPPSFAEESISGNEQRPVRKTGPGVQSQPAFQAPAPTAAGPRSLPTKEGSSLLLETLRNQGQIPALSKSSKARNKVYRKLFDGLAETDEESWRVLLAMRASYVAESANANRPSTS